MFLELATPEIAMLLVDTLFSSYKQKKSLKVLVVSTHFNVAKDFIFDVYCSHKKRDQRHKGKIYTTDAEERYVFGNVELFCAVNPSIWKNDLVLCLFPQNMSDLFKRELYENTVPK